MVETHIKILPIDTYQRMKVALAALRIPKSVIDHVDWNDLGVHNGGYWFLPAKANREEVTRLPKGVKEQFVKVLVEKIGTGRENEGIKVKKFKIHVKDGARYGYIHADDLKGPGMGDVPNAYLDATMEAPRNRAATPLPGYSSARFMGELGQHDYAIMQVNPSKYKVDMPGGKSMDFNNLGQAIVFVRRDQAVGHHYGKVIVTNAMGETRTLEPPIHSPNAAKMSKAQWNAYWASTGKKIAAFFKGGKKKKKTTSKNKAKLVQSGPATGKKAKKPMTAAKSEKMVKVAKILKKLQHATPATQEGLENELKTYIDPADYGVESIQEILYDVDGASARAKLSRQSGVAMSVFDDIQEVGKGNEAGSSTPRRPRAPKGWKWQSPLILVRVAKQDWDVDPKGKKSLKDAYVEATEYEDDEWEIVDYDPSPAGGHSGVKMSTKAASVAPPKTRVQERMVEIARNYEQFLKKKK